jgi:hypothetical protein
VTDRARSAILGRGPSLRRRLRRPSPETALHARTACNCCEQSTNGFEVGGQVSFPRGGAKGGRSWPVSRRVASARMFKHELAHELCNGFCGSYSKSQAADWTSVPPCLGGVDTVHPRPRPHPSPSSVASGLCRGVCLVSTRVGILPCSVWLTFSVTEDSCASRGGRRAE